jgi:hypothetical protein
MTITAVKLASGVGTGSAVSVYTVPAATTVVIKQANFTNTTGGALTVTLVAVNDGTAERAVESAKSLSANVSYQPPGLIGLTMTAGQILKVNAAALIDFWVSGIAIT